ncbi:hypothetical protein HaLaN_15292 [Haematococcus lacustris]|uniref:Uncharacterized protein n=1 Tax=Haematococcus lacustris TaxID=44745 RepID=A0A699ZHC4_HAELA|nr:hypothetical protein HaLaN_15292 [Haematococcus lacustris]
MQEHKSSGYPPLAEFFKACRKVVERPNSGKIINMQLGKGATV